jgi:hypothetical protein
VAITKEAIKMKSRFPRIRLAILASLVGMLTVACYVFNILNPPFTPGDEEATQYWATETAKVPTVDPATLPDTPTALPGTYVATLDLVDEKITNDCGGAEFCAYTVQGTLKYFTPVSAGILCTLRGSQPGYSDPVDLGSDESGTVALSATFPVSTRVGDPTDWFKCNMDGEGVHLLVNKEQSHSEVEVMP